MTSLRGRWAARDWTTARIWGLVLLFALSGWWLVWRDPAGGARRDCLRQYAQARTLADTLRIDRQGGAPGTKQGPWNCGMLRRAVPPPDR